MNNKMISKETLKSQLLSNALSCGSLDVDFFIDLCDKVENKQFKIKCKSDFLFYVDKEGDFIDMLYENYEELYGTDNKPNINNLICSAFCIILIRLSKIYNIKDGLHDYCEIYTNYLDSHLCLKDETGFNKLPITKEEKEEIVKIIEDFN